MPIELKTFAEYGLTGVIIGFVCILLFLIVKWTLATTRDILKQAAQEREIFNSTIINITKSLENHTTQASEFHNQVAEAHRYQREEHTKQLETMSYVLAGFKEVEKALGRINGYSRG